MPGADRPGLPSLILKAIWMAKIFTPMSDYQTTSNIFTDDGRLLQAEYAIKSVSKAGTIVGLTCTDGVVLIGINPGPTTSLEKIYQINDSVYCAVAGIFSDALRLIKFGRLTSANVQETILEVPHVSVICNRIAKEKQGYTQRSAARPFGVSFLYCGVDDSGYLLYSTDPSGTVNKWRAWSFGADEDAINSGLKNELPDELVPMDVGVEALFGILGKARECTPDVAERMEVLLYSKDHSRFLGTEEIERIIRKCKATPGK